MQTLAPDLLIIGFGTNDDTSDDRAQQKYEENIRTIIEAARVANADCQIVLVSPFPSREGSKSAQSVQRVCDALCGIVESEDYLDIMAVDMFKFCKPMLQVKNYYEISGNNINHPNDFIHRCYAMNILSGLFDLSK